MSSRQVCRIYADVDAVLAQLQAWAKHGQACQGTCTSQTSNEANGHNEAWAERGQACQGTCTSQTSNKLNGHNEDHGKKTSIHLTTLLYSWHKYIKMGEKGRSS